MKKTEKEILVYIKKALDKKIDTREFSYDIGDYMFERTDQLEIDNLALYDYLQEEIPEFAEKYGNISEDEWLEQLKAIYLKAKQYVK
jgi:hypothetical protein